MTPAASGTSSPPSTAVSVVSGSATSERRPRAARAAPARLPQRGRRRCSCRRSCVRAEASGSSRPAARTGRRGRAPRGRSPAWCRPAAARPGAGSPSGPSPSTTTSPTPDEARRRRLVRRHRDVRGSASPAGTHVQAQRPAGLQPDRRLPVHRQVDRHRARRPRASRSSRHRLAVLATQLAKVVDRQLGPLAGGVVVEGQQRPGRVGPQRGVEQVGREWRWVIAGQATARAPRRAVTGGKVSAAHTRRRQSRVRTPIQGQLDAEVRLVTIPFPISQPRLSLEPPHHRP